MRIRRIIGRNIRNARRMTGLTKRQLIAERLKPRTKVCETPGCTSEVWRDLGTSLCETHQREFWHERERTN